MQGCEAMRAFLSRAELTREALDLCLSLASFGRHTSAPIVELLFVLANLAIYRGDVRARGCAGAWQIGTFYPIGNEAD